MRRGLGNFDTIRTDFFRDATPIRLALKAGDIDFRSENQAKAWAEDYDVAVVKNGLLKKELVPHQMPTGMQAFVMNTRRSLFADARVREALGLAFDFEWTNRNLFNGQYSRTTSFFSNSDLAASGLPEGEEKIILESFGNRVARAALDQALVPPVTDGSGYLRKNLKRANTLLSEAGWVVKNLKLVNAKTSEPFRFPRSFSLPRHLSGLLCPTCVICSNWASRPKCAWSTKASTSIGFDSSISTCWFGYGVKAKRRERAA